MTINLGFDNYAIIRWNALLLCVFGFNFDFGWFGGNEFVLLGIDLLELREDYPTGYSGVMIFSIQVAKFIISFSYFK